jgi:hypothetical protein
VPGTREAAQWLADYVKGSLDGGDEAPQVTIARKDREVGKDRVNIVEVLEKCSTPRLATVPVRGGM